MRRVLLVALLLLTSRATRAQSSTPVYRANGLDVASVVGAGALYLVPSLLHLPDTTGACAPCDPATLSGIDRGAVQPVSSTVELASGAALLAVAAGAAYASLHGLPGQQMRGNVAVLANALAWTATSGEWLKVVFHRERPVMYTADAPAALADRDNLKSFPSGHTALAFAAATSYLVIAQRQHLPHRERNALLLYGGATLVGALRVVAGKHFPTDALGGAALGIGIGWLVPTIHPTVP
ncbi:MAG TPA: phosphatase PAP2 family protein [Gemmatimonadales bacterium]|nr:phosphatase PAP2 family protein [Gemmatimonadales bacterium]